MATLGAQVVPAKALELRRLLVDLSAADVGALDESLGQWMERPLGREALVSVVFPAAGSVYVCLFNFEPAGLMLLERGQVAARVRALAVAPDLRRRGLARTLLEAAEALAREADLHWLWMSVPSANLPATCCALACGYRRYRPQLMRRQLSHALPLRVERAHVERMDKDEADAQLMHWIRVATDQGDAWCSELARADLLPGMSAHLDGGEPYLLVSAAEEVGVASLQGTPAHRTVTLWLDRRIWNTPRELHVFKAVLDTVADIPATLDVEFGSSGHLRASAAMYKALGFAPVLRERVTMVKKVG